MADPALLSLLRSSDDKIFAEKESNRVRKQGAHVVGIRPQAKHVRSDRVLSKEDEEELQLLQEKAEAMGQYLNPLVPKRREYLAQQQEQQQLPQEDTHQAEQTQQNRGQSTMERLLHPESNRQQDFDDEDEDDNDEEGSDYDEENHEEEGNTAEKEDDEDDEANLEENPTADAVLKQLLHPSIPSTSKTLLFADVLRKRNESKLKTVW